MLITPSEGFALDTEFEISLVDFRDEEFPLSYKYMLYSS